MGCERACVPHFMATGSRVRPLIPGSLGCWKIDVEVGMAQMKVVFWTLRIGALPWGTPFGRHTTARMVTGVQCETTPPPLLSPSAPDPGQEMGWLGGEDGGNAGWLVSGMARTCIPRCRGYNLRLLPIFPFIFTMMVLGKCDLVNPAPLFKFISRVRG